MNTRYLPYILIAPAALFLGLFFIYPFFLVASQAFISDGSFSLKHFQDITSYWKFPISLQNTLYLTAAVVPVQLGFALLMATTMLFAQTA